MIEVNFLEDGTVEDSNIAYVVIMAKHKSKWIMVRHETRSTWELPGGRREQGEALEDAAARELFEETGARKFTLYKVSLYSVKDNGRETYGYIFYADVNELGVLPNFEISEISLVDSLPKNLAYPLIQSQIYHKVLDYDHSEAKGKSSAYNFD